MNLVQGFGVWDGGDDEEFLGPDRGEGRAQDKGSIENSDDFDNPDALDSAVQEWEKLSKMRKTARN